MDRRKLTFILVPHGDLETRTYEITYGWLKIILASAGVLIAGFIVMAALWWSLAARAAEVPRLEREVATLEAERDQVTELARTLSEVEAQYERVRSMLGADAAPAGEDPWLPPLRSGTETVAPAAPETDLRPSSWPLTVPGYITQRLEGEGRDQHPGLDIAVPSGSYVRASGGGTIRAAGEDDVYGLYVLVDHGDGYQSLYGHVSQIFVDEGAIVDRHEVIALTGSTGRSTAPHLHFEIRREGEAIDPLTLVRQPDS